MQDLHFAFHRKLCHRDGTARLEFQLGVFSDAGVILRARDQAHFHLLHFPKIGQQCRMPGSATSPSRASRPQLWPQARKSSSVALLYLFPREYYGFGLVCRAVR